jgi:hypothetical protein
MVAEVVVELVYTCHYPTLPLGHGGGGLQLGSLDGSHGNDVKLKDLRKKVETYDQIIEKLLQIYEKSC